MQRVLREVVIYLLYSTFISTPSIIVFINYGIVYAREFLKINAGEWGFYESISNIFITFLH